MHIDIGIPGPWVCLQVNHVLRGIKRSQGLTGSSRLPAIEYHMLNILKLLYFSNQDLVMFWATSTLDYFGPLPL